MEAIKRKRELPDAAQPGIGWKDRVSRGRESREGPVLLYLHGRRMSTDASSSSGYLSHCAWCQVEVRDMGDEIGSAEH